jgi:hypothetical protein
MNDQDQKTTITLAQWCAYLPYGLQIKHDNFERAAKLTAAKLENIIDSPEFAEKMKPLLRPMNDPKIEWLIEEVYNSKVYWTTHIKYWSHNNEFIMRGDSKIAIENLPNSIIQVLLATHYDIFNLIGQGLALPIE